MPGRIVVKSKSKYRNVRTEVDGIFFCSKKEAKRYGELKLLEKAGKIKNLQLQTQFDLIVNGMVVCRYRSDFTFMGEDGLVVEDVKGVKTAVYVIKRNLMKALYNITIVEI